LSDEEVPSGPITTPCGSNDVASNAILVVDELEGEETSISLQARSGQAHLSYWRCGFDGPPGKGGLPTLGSGSHRYAVVARAGGALSPKRRETIGINGPFLNHLLPWESGRGTTLSLDDSGVPTVLALEPDGTSVIASERKNDSLWFTSMVASPGYLTELRHLRDREGVLRAAWVELSSPVSNPAAAMLEPSAIGQAKGLSGSWSTTREPLSIPLAKRLALDPDGGLHRAWITSGQTYRVEGSPPPPPPPETLWVEAPGRVPEAATVFEKHEVGYVLALAADAAGRMHVLFTRHDLRIQSLAAEVLYATNTSSAWQTHLLSESLPRAGLIPERAAITVDGAGQVHLAIAATIQPGTMADPGPVERVLLVGRGSAAGWRFATLAIEAVGELAVAAEACAPELTWVATFGAKNVQVATVVLP
jgi:hypothetical protein